MKHRGTPKPAAHVSAIWSLVLAVLLAVLALSCNKNDDEPIETIGPFQGSGVTEVPGQQLFVGDLNGISFERGQVIPEIQQCPRESLKALSQEDVHRAVEASDLGFQATYVPAGFDLALESGLQCEDRVIQAVRAFADQQTGITISISRARRMPLHSS